MLNPICHLLALLGAHPILCISKIRVNGSFKTVISLLENRAHLSNCAARFNLNYVIFKFQRHLGNSLVIILCIVFCMMFYTVD
jgi:ABC-type maltose transport system permease subunit